MRKCVFYLTLITLCSTSLAMKAVSVEKQYNISVDSIMNQVLVRAPMYREIVKSYEAELYVKSIIDIKRKNHLLKVVPSMFYLQKGMKQYIVETLDSVRFESPNILNIKQLASCGTAKHYKSLSTQLVRNLRINIYNSSLLPDKFLSPLAENARSYYRYELVTVQRHKGYSLYTIKVIPRIHNTQLMEGELVLNDRDWHVQKFTLAGVYGLLKFKAVVFMGDSGVAMFVPQRMKLHVTFRFLGNHIESVSDLYAKYKDIVLYAEGEKRDKRKNKYDLSDAYFVQEHLMLPETDSTAIIAKRPIHLSGYEQQLYKQLKERCESTLPKKTKKRFFYNSSVFWGELGDALVRSHTFKLSEVSKVKSSPLINPFFFGYSPSRGFSYRQELKFNILFPKERLLKITPQIGYNFTYKEFYWRVYGAFDHTLVFPASLTVEVGNGNRIYNNSIMDALSTNTDEVVDFNKIDILYYKDIYTKILHHVEPVNGLILTSGFTMHNRRPNKQRRETYLINPSSTLSDRFDALTKAYVSFAPTFEVEWTPDQYYYMNGNRKIKVYSHYPTFSLLYERGIKGFLGSNGQYEQIEFDMQKSVRLGFIRSLYYRVGAGLFTNQEEEHFVDYIKLFQSNLPTGWKDAESGDFQLLDRRWYNASNYYLRANLTYESPFLLLPRFNGCLNKIQKERLYLSVLCVERLFPYFEVGYAFSTHLFNMGLFVNNIHGQFNKIGFKLSFELFTD